jgi:hypothetical protein
MARSRFSPFCAALRRALRNELPRSFAASFAPLPCEALKHLDRLGLMPRIQPLRALFVGDRNGRRPRLRVLDAHWWQLGTATTPNAHAALQIASTH